MPAVLLFLIFIILLVIAIPVSITLGITSVLPSVFDPSFTVGAKYLIRAMFGGLDSFPLLAVPMFVLSGIIMAKGGICKKLFDVFAYFLGRFTAGMPCAVIVTCLFYGAISGSAPATVAAVKQIDDSDSFPASDMTGHLHRNRRRLRRPRRHHPARAFPFVRHGKRRVGQ